MEVYKRLATERLWQLDSINVKLFHLVQVEVKIGLDPLETRHYCGGSGGGAKPTGG